MVIASKITALGSYESFTDVDVEVLVNVLWAVTDCVVLASGSVFERKSNYHCIM